MTEVFGRYPRAVGRTSGLLTYYDLLGFRSGERDVELLVVDDSDYVRRVKGKRNLSPVTEVN